MVIFGACRPARADRFADDRRAVLTPPRPRSKYLCFDGTVERRQSNHAPSKKPPEQGVLFRRNLTHF